MRTRQRRRQRRRLDVAVLLLMVLRSSGSCHVVLVHHPDHHQQHPKKSSDSSWFVEALVQPEGKLQYSSSYHMDLSSWRSCSFQYGIFPLNNNENNKSKNRAVSTQNYCDSKTMRNNNNNQHKVCKQ